MSEATIEVSILVFVLILVRVATFFAVLPFFGRQMIPAVVLIGLSLALSVMWYISLDSIPSAIVDREDGYLRWLGFALAAGAEFLTGAMLGFAIGIFVYPIQIAGAYLAQEMGLSIASMSDPTTQSNSDVVASLLQTVALLLFFVLNLHHFLLRLLGQSFTIVPIGGGGPNIQQVSETGLQNFSSLEPLGLSMIGPIGIALFVILIALILLTKAAPSMNIFSIGLSIRVASGLIFTLLFLPHLFGQVAIQFENAKFWLWEYLSSFGS